MQQYGPISPGALGSPQQAGQSKSVPPAVAKQQLQEAIRGSSEILATASTTLTLFPDTITIDRAKLTVTKRWFFSTASVMSIRIEDILNISANVGPFLGSLVITNRIFNPEQPYTIGRLWRKDALRIKHILQGSIIALQRGIDCSAIPTQELKRMFDQLGEDDHDTP